MAALSSTYRVLVSSREPVLQLSSSGLSLERTGLRSSSGRVAISSKKGAARHGLAVRAEAQSPQTSSRRDIVFFGVSSIGLLLLPIPTAGGIKKEQDLREKLMDDIENLQQRMSKSLEEAKEAVTSMAEEAISSLRSGTEKVAETLGTATDMMKSPQQQLAADDTTLEQITFKITQS